MDDAKINAIADAFKIRCSAIYDICLGSIGLTDIQSEKLAQYSAREAGAGKPLTPNMVAELAKLREKRDNPELPETAKTYCKKWLKEFLYHRRPDIKSKYITKGNLSEEDGFTLMCLELNLGMVYKNTQYHSNEYMQGTDDLFVNRVVYDNKCSWTLDTFPMFETEIPDEKYEWQLNGYAELRGVEDCVLAYTLIDAPREIVEREIRWLLTDNEKYKKVCELVYTKAYFEELKAEFFPDAEYKYFVEVPQADRIAPFAFKKDPGKIETVKQRVIMCREYIKQLLKTKYHGK